MSIKSVSAPDIWQEPPSACTLHTIAVRLQIMARAKSPWHRPYELPRLSFRTLQTHNAKWQTRLPPHKPLLTPQRVEDWKDHIRGVRLKKPVELHVAGRPNHW